MFLAMLVLTCSRYGYAADVVVGNKIIDLAVCVCAAEALITALKKRLSETIHRGTRDWILISCL